VTPRHLRPLKAVNDYVWFHIFTGEGCGGGGGRGTHLHRFDYCICVWINTSVEVCDLRLVSPGSDWIFRGQRNSKVNTRRPNPLLLLMDGDEDMLKIWMKRDRKEMRTHQEHFQNDSLTQTQCGYDCSTFHRITAIKKSPRPLHKPTRSPSCLIHTNRLRTLTFFTDRF